MTYDSFLRSLLPAQTAFHARLEGPAFLNVARNLYGFGRIDYLALDVPMRTRPSRFMHSWHATDGITQCLVDKPIASDGLGELDWPSLKSADSLTLAQWRFAKSLGQEQCGVVYPLRALHGEMALAAVAWDPAADCDMLRHAAVRDLRHLMNYFHSHLLRINGVDTSSELIMTARELDCLSWTAAGKSAWEASIILGISERTVRFHLNVAREKLNCTTTTQAVAKAISQHLITLPAA